MKTGIENCAKFFGIAIVFWFASIQLASKYWQDKQNLVIAEKVVQFYKYSRDRGIVWNTSSETILVKEIFTGKVCKIGAFKDKLFKLEMSDGSTPDFTQVAKFIVLDKSGVPWIFDPTG